jgi:hypothetical protein
MRTRFCRLTGIAGLLAFALLTFTGCTENETNSGSYRHSLTVGGSFADSARVYVIVQDSAGVQTLAASELTGPGFVRFPPLGDRISVSIASVAGLGWYRIWTYLGVEPGDWQFGVDDIRKYDSHRAEFDFSYPRGQYTRLELRFGRSSYEIPLTPRDSVSLHQSITVHSNRPDSTFSLIAVLHGGDSTYYGWMVDQPAPVSDTAHYALRLDRVTEVGTFTAAQPMTSCEIMLTRGNVPDLFSEIDAYNSAGLTSVSFDHCSQFPFDRVWIQLCGATDAGSFDYFVSRSDLPGGLLIPGMSVTATWDQATKSFRGITTTETPDVVIGTWYGNNCRGESWQIYARPGTTVITQPVFPDSIMQAIGLPSFSLVHGSIIATDWDTAQNYDEMVPLLVRSIYNEHGYHNEALNASHYDGLPGSPPANRSTNTHVVSL